MSKRDGERSAEPSIKQYFDSCVLVSMQPWKEGNHKQHTASNPNKRQVEVCHMKVAVESIVQGWETTPSNQNIYPCKIKSIEHLVRT